MGGENRIDRGFLQSGPKVPYAPTERPRKRLSWYLLVLAVLSLPGYFAFRGLYYLLAVNAPAYVEMQQTAVTAPHLSKTMPLRKAIFEPVIQKQVGLPANIKTPTRSSGVHIIGQTFVVDAG